MSAYTTAWDFNFSGAFTPFASGQELPFFFEEGWNNNPASTPAFVDYVDELYHGPMNRRAPFDPLGMTEDGSLPMGSIASTGGMDDPLLWSNPPWQASVWAPSPTVNTYTPAGSASYASPPLDLSGMEWTADSVPIYPTCIAPAPAPQDPASYTVEQVCIAPPPQAGASSPSMGKASTKKLRKSTPKSPKKQGATTLRPRKTKSKPPKRAAPKRPAPLPIESSPRQTKQERMAKKIVKGLKRPVGKAKWKCPNCDHKTPRKGDLTRHIQSHLRDLRPKCVGCNRAFSRKDGLDRHYDRFIECYDVLMRSS